MKKTLTSLTVVIVFILLMTITISAFTSSVLSNPTYSTNINGIKYVEKSTTENSSKQYIFYGEYNTTAEDAEYEWVVHSIRDGSNTTLSTVMDIAKDYEATTGRKVMLATNGDYFYATGANVDSYVNNGIVVTQGNMANKNCIGFDNNGKVVVGRMTEVDTRLVIYDENDQPQFFEIDKFNQQPASGEIAVYNTAGTYTVTNAGAMIVKSDSSNLTTYPVWGSDYTMTVAGVQSSKTFTLKTGQFAVVYTDAHNDIFGKHVYGDPVDLVEIPAGDFAGCTWVLGGYDALVNNYTVNTNCHTDNSGSAAAPRTFIGFKEDGTGFLCVVDGRQSGHSIGITVNQEAQLASVLGAKYALELDGGGSSTMIVRINDVLTLRNSPSDGSMRKVSNAIMLVEKPKEEEHEHSFVNGSCECGATDPDYVPECTEHVDENSDYVCDVCDAELERPTTPPTCSEHTDENADNICDVCEAEIQNTDDPGNTDGEADGAEDNTQDNSFWAFLKALINAILKFFMNLFS